MWITYLIIIFIFIVRGLQIHARASRKRKHCDNREVNELSKLYFHYCFRVVPACSAIALPPLDAVIDITTVRQRDLEPTTLDDEQEALSADEE